MTALTVVVRGMPGAQGSKRYLGRGRFVESSAKVTPWREAVRFATVRASDAAGLRSALAGSLGFDCTFTLPRPKSHFGTCRNIRTVRDSAPMAPSKVPDLEKLVRSTFDALTESGVWDDDAQVVEIVARKSFPGYGPNSLDFPGAMIRITSLEIPQQVAPMLALRRATQ